MVRRGNLDTGYRGGKGSRLPPDAAAYDLENHPYVQLLLYLSNGYVVALFDQANQARCVAVSEEEVRGRLPNFDNVNAWQRGVNVNHKCNPETGEHTVHFQEYDAGKRAIVTRLVRHLERKPLILFLLGDFHSFFGRFHTPNALWNAGVPPFAPAAVFFTDVKVQRGIRAHYFAHRLLALSGTSDIDPVRNAVVQRWSRVFNRPDLGCKVLKTGGQPNRPKAPTLPKPLPLRAGRLQREQHEKDMQAYEATKMLCDFMYRLGHHLWVPGKKSQLGALWRADVFGTPVEEKASSFRGGSFDGFKPEEYRPATLGEPPPLQLGPHPKQAWQAPPKLSAARSILGVAKALSAVKGGIKKTKPANAIGRPPKVKTGKAGKPPKGGVAL